MAEIVNTFSVLNHEYASMPTNQTFSGFMPTCPSEIRKKKEKNNQTVEALVKPKGIAKYS